MNDDSKQVIRDQLYDVLDSFDFKFERILPSEWAEKYRVMTSDVSPYPGKFSYKLTPYLREVVDCLDPSTPVSRVAVMKGAQIGYALDVNTIIPTPKGFVKMLNLKVGDKVLGSDGKPTNVTKATDVMYDHECYEVTFTDGSKIVCDKDHLWTVYDLKNIERTLSTEKISKKFKKIPKNPKMRSRNRYHVKNPKPVINKKIKLPINPYLLGVWLGDGSTNSNCITCEEKDLPFYLKEFSKRNIEVKYKEYKNQNGCYQMRIQNEFNVWKGGKNIYGNKHIPEIYFTASIDQRLELLQGLIDTDGHVMKNGNVEFYNTNEKLIHQVHSLISSLGFKAVLRKRLNENVYCEIIPGKRYKAKPLFVLNFKGYQEMPCALLPRKRNRLKSRKDIRSEIHKKWICNVEKVESVPVKCISVDNDSHLYLAGENYIPTHNSTGVIEPGIGWIIKENPGNTLFFVGHSDLVDKAMSKVDQVIDSSGIRHLIQSNSMRKKNQKTGDTNTTKEFPGGFLMLGSPGNHKAIRQLSARYGFFDDYESIQGSTKQSGDTKAMIEQRFAAYEDKMKLFYISTPELEQTSNIEPLYLQGDQRRWFVPCPSCGEYQTLEWIVKDDNGKKIGGIVWEVDSKNKIVEGSVGYQCPKCSDVFEDKHKYKMNLKGEWRPTAEARQKRFRSYHISALYAPPGFKSWESYVQDWLDAHPKDQQPNEVKLQSFYNLCLGKTWKLRGKSIQSSALQKNQGRYEIGEIPTKLSKDDGNGDIFIVTCGIDLNGLVDDARLDYEIVAWSTSGSSYSVIHGSIGTFESRKGNKGREKERDKWTYYVGYPNSVWPELERILSEPFKDPEGAEWYVRAAAIDVGNYTKFAYDFMSSYEGDSLLFGFKGEGKLRKPNSNDPYVREMKEREGCYLLHVNYIKDELHEKTGLKWDENSGQDQPAGFMNFPYSQGRTFSYKQYFQHFEAEQKVISKNARGEETGWEWKKKTDSAQNHLYDCHIYNIGLLRLLEYLVCKEAGVKLNWDFFVDQF